VIYRFNFRSCRKKSHRATTNSACVNSAPRSRVSMSRRCRFSTDSREASRDRRWAVPEVEPARRRT